MRAEAQKVAQGLAVGRVLVGVSLCVAPNVAAQWAGDDVRNAGAHVITRALGARDAALGLGTLTSVHEPSHLRRWLVASSACDAADFVVMLAGPRSPRRSLVLAMAAAAAVTGLGAAAAA